jgi:hypothetical protein
VLIHRFHGQPPAIEQIQDVVEQTLIAANHLKTARAYIVYREQHAKLRADRKTLVDVESSINEYLNRQDWRVNANANQGYSLGGLILNVSGKVIANYWLSTSTHARSGRGPPQRATSTSTTSTCWRLLRRLVAAHPAARGPQRRARQGRSRAAETPVQRRGADRQLPGHVAKRVGRRAGVLSFDTYMAPFIRKDKLDYAAGAPVHPGAGLQPQRAIALGHADAVHQPDLRLDLPGRPAEQVPVIGGWRCLQLWRAAGRDGHDQPRLHRGDDRWRRQGPRLHLPDPHLQHHPDFPWDSENADRLFDMTAKYGLPYFQNFVNSELKPNMVRSMCCRLQLDLRELLKRGNGLFGSAEQTGSLGVVTVNCARLGYLHKGDEAGLLARLDVLLEMGRDSLEIKRKVIQGLMDQGLFPYTKRYLGTLRNHFSTLGVNGINEMIRNFSDDAHDITSDWGHAFACRLLDHVRARMVEFQEETGHLYNLEATPAEGTTYRFAKEDRKRWADILQAGTPEQPYYSNSSQLPVGFTDDPFEALSRQEALQAKYTGGTVLHLYMNERISSIEACKTLVRRALTASACPTSPSRRPSRSARRTAISPASTSSARSAMPKSWHANA